MKKHFLFVITLVLALLSLCSCGSSDQNAYAAWAALSGSSYLDYNSGYIAPDAATDTNGDGETTDNTDTEAPAETPAEPTYTDEAACNILFDAITADRDDYSSHHASAQFKLCQLERTSALDEAAQYYAQALEGEESFAAEKLSSRAILEALYEKGLATSVSPMFIKGYAAPSDVRTILQTPANYGYKASKSSPLYSRDYQKIGIARYQGKDGTNYWAILFIDTTNSDD